MRSASSSLRPRTSPWAYCSSPTSAIHPSPGRRGSEIRLGHERSRKSTGDVVATRLRQQLAVCGDFPAAQCLALSIEVIAACCSWWEPWRDGPGGTTPIPDHANERAAGQRAPDPSTPGHAPAGGSASLRGQPATLGTLMSQRAVADDWIARLQARRGQFGQLDAETRKALDAEIQLRKRQRQRAYRP